MIETLKLFTSGKSLFEATSGLLAKLNIEFDRETAEPIDVADIYDNPMPAYLTEALQSIEHTYFIGIVNDQSLAGAKSDDSLDEIAETIQHGGKYNGMFVFACDAKENATLTRTQSSALARAFNRIAASNPVILVIRQGNLLSLATCERTEYVQTGRQGNGEKVGKVSILRNIDCNHPHRGHVDILESLGDKAYTTFEELYKHWMEVFSSELLTKKFYNELSDWYAWAVQIVKFPNDLRTTEDDAKFNHEACIRLITRLIFVWFLKQKHLIPEEFFDENYIRENLIENFNPHDKQNLLYNTEQSKYYRLILQNLFFAMLNCPIVAERKSTPNNRRFRKDDQYGYVKGDYNVNNLMRYKKEFAENGGAEKFVKLANRSVPFLNGGLFDCLDKKDKGLYYDGFSERKESLAQLFFPDYLFFGEEVGNGIDLSQWYDDKKKKNVSARGIIDILKRYSFTIEENTPYDQEVSLDPELLGKVFENLLAAYNPETKQTARKQTGSFYTPREIVQYMVDESLVAHLKRMCGEDKETQYRALLNYATDDIELSEDERKSIMKAIYNCRVLDPACGSGAFPMGVLQQMVHVLKRIDPTNEMWNSMMVDIAIQDAKKELEKVASGDATKKAKIEDNRQARLADIENAFNQSVNDPDYARKLYLIERCIYGVDIQPIATQISKLRFFISLVVDQKPTKDAKNNFGIRPLPNLEAKFVTANTLIPLDRSRDLFTSVDEIRYYEEQLQEINHRIFTAKKNTVKRELQQLMTDTRLAMAQSMENLGAIGPKGYQQLTGWDPFDQNASASFFDPEWMFGVKNGFDIVIANPPYVDIKALPNKDVKSYFQYYSTAENRINLYSIFIEKGLLLGNAKGILCYINPNSMLVNESYLKIRKKIINTIDTIIKLPDSTFLSASVETIIELICKDNHKDMVRCYIFKKDAPLRLHNIDYKYYERTKWQKDSTVKFNIYASNEVLSLLEKISDGSIPMENYILTSLGITPYDKAKGQSAELIKNRGFHSAIKLDDSYVPLISGKNIHQYYISDGNEEYLKYGNWLGAPRERKFFVSPKIIVRQILAGPNQQIVAAYSEQPRYFTQIGFSVISKTEDINILKFLTCLLNSKLMSFYHRYTFLDLEKVVFQKILIANTKKLPVKLPINYDRYILLLNSIQAQSLQGENSNAQNEIDFLVYHLYDLTYDEVLIVDPNTPITREQYESGKYDE